MQNNKNSIKLKRFKQVQVKLKFQNKKHFPAETPLHCTSPLRMIVASLARAHERVRAHTQCQEIYFTLSLTAK